MSPSKISIICLNIKIIIHLIGASKSVNLSLVVMSIRPKRTSQGGLCSLFARTSQISGDGDDVHIIMICQYRNSLIKWWQYHGSSKRLSWGRDIEINTLYSFKWVQYIYVECSFIRTFYFWQGIKMKVKKKFVPIVIPFSRIFALLFFFLVIIFCCIIYLSYDFHIISSSKI